MPHHFFAYMNRMKYIRRWGLMRNTKIENDMEHAFQTAMIAHAIALLGNERYERDYDAEHIAVLGMYHDASEVITGDLPTPIKHNNPAIKKEYHKLESIAQKRLLTMHVKATGSKKAREILEHFSEYLPKFRAVISDEYLAYLKGA